MCHCFQALDEAKTRYRDFVQTSCDCTILCYANHFISNRNAQFNITLKYTRYLFSPLCCTLAQIWWFSSSHIPRTTTLVKCFDFYGFILIYRLDVESKLSEQLKLAFFSVRAEDKLALLLHLLRNVIPRDQLTVIFTATKHYVDYLNLVSPDFFAHWLFLHLSLFLNFLYSHMTVNIFCCTTHSHFF